MNKLTPVQSVGGLLFKRDDLYEPFGPGEVNGGKMRQCMMLLDSVKDEISGVISCCSIHSPQAPITASGVMIGLNRYGKKVRNVHLVATAPDRRESIHRTLREHGADRDFIYHDLFHTEGFAYEKPATAVWGGITLHPNYEAKTMQWFVKSGLDPGSTLFWIVGAAPRNIPAAGRP